MKRHEQSTGVRKWSGDDLIELQDEGLKVLDDYLSLKGNVVITGCKVDEDIISAGLVSLGGKVMPFEGVTDVDTFPIYLIADISIEQREYVDGAVKNIAKSYKAIVVTEKPESDYIEIGEDGDFGKYTSPVNAPTLESMPTSSTLTYSESGSTYRFAIGQFCRAYNEDKERYILYQLCSVDEDNSAKWQIVDLNETTTTESVTVNLVSNQGLYDSSLLGVTIWLEYGNTTISDTWAGSPLVFTIPQGVECTLSTTSLDNYSSPQPQTFTTIGGSRRNLFMCYNCERVVVSLSSDGDVSLVNQTVTVKNAATEATIGSGTGAHVVVKVPIDTLYTISVSGLSEYKTPEANTYTASLMERDVNINYTKWSSSSIVFDKSISDPANITGDINSGYIAILLSKFRRCLCKKTDEGEVSIAYLSDTNSNYYVDGTDAILTGAEGDVMVDFPEFYYKCNIIDENKYRYTFAESNIDGSYTHVERSLVGAYKGYVSNDMLHSYSGVQPTQFLSYDDYLETIALRGEGYQLIDFQQHCVIAFMMFAKYGTRNLQAVLGSGDATYSEISATATGTTNSIGNKDTVLVDSGYVNGLAIEGVFGGIYELVQGVTVTDRVWTITDPDGTIRTKVAANESGYIMNVTAENGAPFDLIPTSIGASGSTFYTDYYYQVSGGPVQVCRSCHSSSAVCGVAFVSAYNAASYQSSSITSRLAFRGVINETAVSEFKTL